MVALECRFLRISAWIRMVFISEWRINFASPGPASAAQPVNGTPLRNGSEPGRERTVRIVGLPRLMNGEQSLLNNIVYEIGSYSLATRDSFYKRYAVAQQRFIGGSIAGLGSDHPCCPPTVNFRVLTGRPCIHRRRPTRRRRCIHRSRGHARFIEK